MYKLYYIELEITGEYTEPTPIECWLTRVTGVKPTSSYDMCTDTYKYMTCLTVPECRILGDYLNGCKYSYKVNVGPSETLPLEVLKECFGNV